MPEDLTKIPDHELLRSLKILVQHERRHLVAILRPGDAVVDDAMRRAKRARTAGPRA